MNAGKSLRAIVLPTPVWDHIDVQEAARRGSRSCRFVGKQISERRPSDGEFTITLMLTCEKGSYGRRTYQNGSGARSIQGP